VWFISGNRVTIRVDTVDVTRLLDSDYSTNFFCFLFFVFFERRLLFVVAHAHNMLPQQSLESNASLRINVVPVGDVSSELFESYLSVLRRFSTIALRDVTPPGSYSRKSSALQGMSWSGSGVIRLNFVRVERQDPGASHPDQRAVEATPSALGDSFAVIDEDSGASESDSPRGGGRVASGSPDARALWRVDGIGDGVQGSLSTLQSHHRVFGLVGVCHCPSTEDLAAAFEGEFKLAKRTTPTAAVCRCFAFEPSDVQMCVDGGVELTIVPGDRALEGEVTFARKQGLHLKTVLQTMCTCLIEAIDAWLSAPECGPIMAAGKPLPPPKSRDGAAAAAELCTAWDVQWPAESQGRFRRRISGRDYKWRGDLCLLAGSPIDALGHYSNALRECRKEGDGLWAAAAHEGLAAAKLAAWSAAYGPPQAESLFSPRRRASSPPYRFGRGGGDGGGGGAADGPAGRARRRGSGGNASPRSSSTAVPALVSPGAVPSAASGSVASPALDAAALAQLTDWQAVDAHTAAAIAGYAKQGGAAVLGCIATLKLIRLRAVSIAQMSSPGQRVARGERRRELKAQMSALWSDVSRSAGRREPNFCGRVAVQCALVSDAAGLSRSFALWLWEAVRMCAAGGEVDSAHAQLDVLAMRSHPWPQVQLAVLRKLLELAGELRAPSLVNRHALELLERSARGGGSDCIEWRRAAPRGARADGHADVGRLLSAAQLAAQARTREREEQRCALLSPPRSPLLNALDAVLDEVRARPLSLPSSAASPAGATPQHGMSPVMSIASRRSLAGMPRPQRLPPALFLGAAEVSSGGRPTSARIASSADAMARSPRDAPPPRSPRIKSGLSTPRGSKGATATPKAETIAEALRVVAAAESSAASGATRPRVATSGGSGDGVADWGVSANCAMAQPGPGGRGGMLWSLTEAEQTRVAAMAAHTWSHAAAPATATCLASTIADRWSGSSGAPVGVHLGARAARVRGITASAVQSHPQSLVRVVSLAPHSQSALLDPVAFETSTLPKVHRTVTSTAPMMRRATSGEHLSELRVAGATVMLAERRKRAASMVDEIRWTAREAARVDAVLHNPLSVEVVVTSLSLWASVADAGDASDGGADRTGHRVDGDSASSCAECYPLTVTIAPLSTLTVSLVLKPHRASAIALHGCSMCYLGAWRDVRALDGVKRAVVYPPHPRVALASDGLGAQSVHARPGGSAASAEEAARGAEGGGQVQRLALLRGEFRPLQLSIENVGESPIVALCVSIAVEYDDDTGAERKTRTAERVLWAASSSGGADACAGDRAEQPVAPSTPITRSISANSADDASPLLRRPFMLRRTSTGGSDAPLHSPSTPQSTPRSASTKVRLRRATLRKRLSSCDDGSPLERFASKGSLISSAVSDAAGDPSWKRRDGDGDGDAPSPVCWRRFSTVAVSKTMVTRRRRTTLHGNTHLNSSSRQDAKEAASAALELHALGLVEWQLLALELDEGAALMALPLESGAKIPLPIVLRGVEACSRATLCVECLSEFPSDVRGVHGDGGIRRGALASTGGDAALLVPRVRAAKLPIELDVRPSVKLVSANVLTVGLPAGDWGILGRSMSCQRIDSDAPLCLVALRVRNEGDDVVTVEGSHSSACVVSALLHARLVGDDARAPTGGGMPLNTVERRRKVAVGACDAPSVTRRADLIGCEGLATFEYAYDDAVWTRAGAGAPRVVVRPVASTAGGNSGRSPTAGVHGGVRGAARAALATPRRNALQHALDVKGRGELAAAARRTTTIVVAPHSEAVLLLPVPRVCAALRWKLGGGASMARGKDAPTSRDDVGFSLPPRGSAVAAVAAAEVMGDTTRAPLLGRIPLPLLNDRLSVTWRSTSGAVGLLDLKQLATAGATITQRAINRLVPPPLSMRASLRPEQPRAASGARIVAIAQWVTVRVAVRRTAAQGAPSAIGGASDDSPSIPMTLAIIPRAHGGEVRGARPLVATSLTTSVEDATRPPIARPAQLESASLRSGDACESDSAHELWGGWSGANDGDGDDRRAAPRGLLHMRAIAREIVADRKYPPVVGRLYRDVRAGNEWRSAALASRHSLAN
jgi:hypothetical protein